MGAGKMERELVGVAECSAAIKALERFGDGGVQKPRAGLPQLGVDHLLEERVREIVVNRINASGFRQHALTEQLVHGRDDFHLGQRGDLRRARNPPASR